MAEEIKNYIKKKITLYKERCEEKRAEFQEKLKIISPEKIVYIDEAGVDNRLYTEYGRAPRGKRIYAEISGKKRERISIIAGLCKKKFYAPFLFQGSCNSDVFNIWLEKVLLPNTDEGTTIVMDNAAFHKSEHTKTIIEKFNCYLLFLPTYSPDLNPIEHKWHTVKSLVRQQLKDWNGNLQSIVSECLLNI